MHIGLDIGSISVNTVLMEDSGRILENHYTCCHGKPFAVLGAILEGIHGRYGDSAIELIAVTGTGGRLAASLIGGRFVNEIVAQSSAAARLYPQTRTIIEMGGEDSKLILMEHKNGRSQLADFAMNSICAAGTGSFLDQQARRIGVRIEQEFGELALKSEQPPRIAGRCSVFAKSDMIHLQQIATPLEDIVAGLCFAVARNFKSSLTRGKKTARPFLFQGGVAANAGMVRAFREIFDLAENELIVPAFHASMGAIGALFYLLDHEEPGRAEDRYRGPGGLVAYLEREAADGDHLEPLRPSAASGGKPIRPLEDRILEVYLGLDVGSLSTNVVLIDDRHRVVARRYLPTAGRPLEAIRRGLEEIRREVGERVRVQAAGTTGSGRYLTGDFIGADTVQNEITAQATAVIDIDPRVDTIFEIGGQDSKFISIEGGVIVDFEMNKVCAAGTGSFLEEQAEKLDINIIGEFGELALRAPAPARLGDRCTVFMESDLNAHQQKGVSKENLVGGLAYSIVHNYLQKVVGTKRVGERIFFQGGVTNNRAVVAAFEKVTGKAITVPPHFDVTGAIGAAILAKEAVAASPGRRTAFKGFEISRSGYTLDRYTCKRCPNQCDIRRVKIQGETRPLRYGDRCGRFDARMGRGGGDSGGGRGLPNLFTERLALLLGDYREETGGDRPSIGLPRGLMLFHQQFPFWRAFFETLGLRVVLSSPSNRRLVTRSLEMLVAETCFPVEVMHGHVLDLFDRRVENVFIPFIINSRAERHNPTLNFNCPWIQTYPFMIRGVMRGDPREHKLLIPSLHFRFGRRVLEPELRTFAGRTFGASGRAVSRALEAAEQAQDAFEAAVRRRGRELLDTLPPAGAWRSSAGPTTPGTRS